MFEHTFSLSEKQLSVYTHVAEVGQDIRNDIGGLAKVDKNEAAAVYVNHQLNQIKTQKIII